MKKSKRGGKREGAGRRSKWGEETETVAFRVPKSAVLAVTLAVRKAVDKWKRKKGE